MDDLKSRIKKVCEKEGVSLKAWIAIEVEFGDVIYQHDLGLSKNQIIKELEIIRQHLMQGLKI